MATNLYGPRKRIPISLKKQGRGYGYAVGETVLSYNSTSTNLIGKSSRSNQVNTINSMKSINSSNISNATRQFVGRNGLADINASITNLQSGKWYQGPELVKDTMIDLNEDWGDNDTPAESAKAMMDQSENNSKKVINSVNQVGSSISKAYGYATAKSAEAIVKNSTANTRALYDLNAKGFNQVTNALLNMESTMVKIGSAIGEPLSVHVQNSAIFYTKTTESLNAINKNIQTLVDRTSYMDQKASGKYSKSSSNKILMGGFTKDDFTSMVKENAKAVGDVVLESLGFNKNQGKQYGKNLSPMQHMILSAMNIMMPKFFKDSVKGMGESLSYALRTGLSKGSKWAAESDNPWINLLGAVFLPKDRLKTNVNTGNYTKGAVPFDGVTRKSIIEVIPTYLARINAALTGEEKYYDFEKGRFITTKEIRQHQKDDFRYAALQAGGDFRKEAISRLSPSEGKIKQEIDTFFVKAMMLGNDFDTIERNYKNKAWLDKFGLSKEAANVLRKTIQDARRQNSKSYAKFQADVVKGRAKYSNKMSLEESRGYSNLNYINNGMADLMSDAHKKSQLDYLRDINQIVGAIYAAMGGNSTTIQSYNVDNHKIRQITGTTGSGAEKSNMDPVFKRYREDELSEDELIKTWDYSESEIDKYINKRTVKGYLKKIKGESKDKVDNIKNNRVKDKKPKSKFGAFISKAKSSYEKPFEALTNMVNVMTAGINDLFWGADGGSGVIAQLKSQAKNMFDMVKDKLREKASNLWDKTGIGDATKLEWENIKAKGKKFLFGENAEGSGLLFGGASDIYSGAVYEELVRRYGKREANRIIKDLNGKVEGSKKEIKKSAKNAQKRAKEYLGLVKEFGKQKGAELFVDSLDAGKTFKESGAVGVMSEGADILSSGITQFLKQAFTGDPNKDTKGVTESIGKVFKEMDNAKGAMAIGAMGGAGVSLLTSAVVGPLAGAAIGAGVGFLAKSEKAQNFLFGEVDEDTGERQGGLIPKNVQDKLKLTPEFKAKLKAAAPHMAAGGIAGLGISALVGGPFGIAGNLMVGAGLGYLSTTDQFHEYMFGKDGLANQLHDKIFTHVDDFFHNILNRATGFLKKSLINLGSIIADLGKKAAKRIAEGDYSGLPGLGLRTLAFGDKVVKKGIGLVGAPIKALSTHTMKKNLAHGYDVYGRKANGTKGLLTARERNQARQNLGVFGNKDSDFDTMLGNITNKEDLTDLAHELNNAYKGEANYDYFKKKGVDISKFSKGDIGNLKDLVRTEEKTRDWQAAQMKEEQQYHLDIRKYLSGLYEKIVLGKSPKAVTGKTQDQSLEELNIVKRQDKNGKDMYFKQDDAGKLSRMKKRDVDDLLYYHEHGLNENTVMDRLGIVKRQNKNGKDMYFKQDDAGKLSRMKDKEAKEQINSTIFGIEKITTNNQGEQVAQLNDQQTKETNKRKDQFFKAIGSIPLIGGAMNKLGGLMGGIKEKLFGSEDGKKKGFLSGILDMLTGKEGSPLGALATLFAGTKVGGFVSKALAGVSLKSVIKGVLADAGVAAALYGVFSGKLDEIASKITNGAYGHDQIGDKDDIRIDPESGEVLTQDENGDWVRSDGTVVSNVEVRKSGSDSLSSYAIKGTARQVVTGRKTGVGALLKKTHIGKGVSKLAENSSFLKSFKKSTKLMGKVDDMMKLNPAGDKKLLEKGAAKALSGNVDDALVKLAKFAKKFPFVGERLSGAITKAIPELSEKMGVSLAKSGAKAASWAAKAIPVITIGMAIIDFTTGWQDAANTLGILGTPSTGQKALCGVLRVIKNLIPFVGPLIPDKLVVDILVKYIGPVFGMKPEELLKQQDEAQAEVDKYNAENGTNLTVADYNKQVLGNYTWTEKIGNWGKTLKERTKSFVSNAKEQGISKAFKESGLGETLAAPIKKVDDLTGIVSLMNLARKGELKEFITYKPDTEGENGVESVVHQIPVFLTKVAMLPMAVTGFVFKPITKKINEIIDKAKNMVSAVIQAEAEGEESIKGEGGLSDFLTPPSNIGDDDFGLMGKGFIYGAKIMALPIMIGKRIFKGIGKVIGDIVDKTKSTVTTGVSEIGNIGSMMLKGDITGLFDITNTKAADNSNDMGNLGTGLVLAASGAARTLAVIPTAISWVVHKIGDGIGNMINNGKDDIEQFSSSIQKISSISKSDSGVVDKILDISNIEFKPKTNGVISMALNTVFKFAKPFYTIVSAVKALINPLGELLDDLKEKVKEKIDNSWLGKGYNKIKNWIKGGEEESGSGSGFVSQRDSRYAGKSFAGSTFGEKGCGPAVASMAASAMGRNLSVGDAIRASRGYQNSGGTSLDYFGKVLGSKGISTELISGGSSGDLYNRIASGNKVILLGRDPMNTSKANSPFGPNNHYVLATGLDGAGNIRINDPELNGTRSYSPAILKSATYGISGGGSQYDTKTAQQVWAYFKSKGYSPAAIAGIMGNLYQESGVDPTAIQGNGRGPAAGIAQWENYNTKSSRWKTLSDRAKKAGKPWTDLATQLDFMNDEINSNDIKQRMAGKIAPGNLAKAGAKPMTLEQFKSTKDVNQAMRLFEGAFERAGSPMWSNREKAAEAYYKLYEDKNYTWTGDSSSSDSSESNGSSSTNFSTILQAASNVGSIFSNAFSKLFNPSDDSSSDSSSDESTTGNVGNAKGAAAAATAAENELGYKEGPGNITKFGKWSGCDGQPWCAAFAAWAISQAFDGKKSSAVKALYGCDNVNYTPTLTNCFKKNNAWYQTPEVGDEVMYGKPGPYHVGLVTSVDKKKKTFVSVEGNTNDQVSKKQHSSYKDGNVIGFGRPDYSKATNTVSKTDKSNSVPTLSGNEDFSATGSSIDALLRMKSGAGSGLKGISGAGSKKKATTYKKASKVASSGSITSQTTKMLGQLSRNAQRSASNGSVSADLVNKLLEAITALLSTIADNTAPIEKIYQALTSYTSNATTTKHTEGEKVSTDQSEVDQNFTALVGVLAELAKG